MQVLFISWPSSALHWIYANMSPSDKKSLFRGPYIQVTIKAHGPLVKTHINFDAWDHSILQWQKLDVSILDHLLLMNTIISQLLCYLRKWIYTLCRSLDYFCFALEIDIYTTDNARFKILPLMKYQYSLYYIASI